MAGVSQLFHEMNSTYPALSNADMMVGKSKPDQTLAMLLHNTASLKTSLECHEKIVIAAYKVAEYIPDLSNVQHLRFWEKDIIPNLMKSLEQYDDARSTIAYSFKSIDELGIAIQETSKIIKQTKGFRIAVEWKKKNISRTLEKLEKCIEHAEKLENSAINSIVTQSEKLFNIIGPAAANFIEQKSELENIVTELYDEHKQLRSTLEEKRDIEHRSYEKIVMARMKGLRECIFEYETKYVNALIELDSFNYFFENETNAMQTTIDNLYKQWTDIDKKQIHVEGMFGLQGYELIQCLIDIRMYSQMIRGGASVYSPLVTFLNGIKCIVENDVDLLSGSNSDILVAGNRLAKLGGFLLNYSISSDQVLKVSDEFHRLSIKNKSVVPYVYKHLNVHKNEKIINDLKNQPLNQSLRLLLFVSLMFLIICKINVSALVLVLIVCVAYRHWRS